MKKERILRSLINYWGGELVYVERVPVKFMAPFDFEIGCDWKNKIILCTPTFNDPYGLIHEMGHVFASTTHPNKMKKGEEYNFLGWEFALIKTYGLSFKGWEDENNDYGVNENPLDKRLKAKTCEYKNLTERSKKLLVLERLQVAEELGLITSSDEPLNVR